MRSSLRVDFVQSLLATRQVPLLLKYYGTAKVYTTSVKLWDRTRTNRRFRIPECGSPYPAQIVRKIQMLPIRQRGKHNFEAFQRMAGGVNFPNKPYDVAMLLEERFWRNGHVSRPNGAERIQLLLPPIDVVPQTLWPHDEITPNELGAPPVQEYGNSLTQAHAG